MGAQMFEMKAKSVYEGGCKNALYVRDFPAFYTDEPAALGGTDAGANPVEYVLCGLNGCTAITAHIVAHEMNINIEEFEAEVTGALDIKGLMGDPNVSPGLQTITLQVKIKTDATQEQVEQLKETVERRCPVARLFQDAKVNMNVAWIKL